MDSNYTYVWEFRVSRESEPSFLQHYGPDGSWIDLFRQAPGYVETLLLRDPAIAGRYLTVDRWESAQAYQSFREQFAEQYDSLDRICEHLTRQETNLGAFFEIAPRREA